MLKDEIEKNEVINLLNSHQSMLEKWSKTNSFLTSTGSVVIAKYMTGEPVSIRVLPESFKTLKEFHVKHYTASVKKLREKLDKLNKKDGEK